MKPSWCGVLLIVVLGGVAAGADEEANLVGTWKLDREGTRQLLRESGAAADALPDFDFEIELKGDGDAQYTTTLAGAKEGKRVQWQVIPAEAGGKRMLELLPNIGTSKRHQIERLEGDVLELRPQGARHTLVLRRDAEQVKSSKKGEQP